MSDARRAVLPRRLLEQEEPDVGINKVAAGKAEPYTQEEAIPPEERKSDDGA